MAAHAKTPKGLPAARSSVPMSTRISWSPRGQSKPRFISGQKRGVFGVINRELRRRYAIADVIGHMKIDGHLGRSHLKGDAANVILTAVGHNPDSSWRGSGLSVA
jgi:hypothetical protein